jgi:hypothetical protein
MPLRGGLLSEFFKAWEIYRSDGKMKSRERASVPLPAFLGIDEFQPEPPAAKQKTELPLKNQRKMSEQPGPPQSPACASRYLP